MAEIQSLSIKHTTIMDFLMVNPQMRLGDVANHFGITQPWLSSIIHSDIFQAMLKEKSDICFHSTVLPLREKMAAVAHIAMDKLAEQLPKETEAKIISDVAVNVLDRLGFSPKLGPTVQVNNTQVSVLRSELDEARALLGRAERPRSEVILDGVALPLSVRSEAEMGTPDKRGELALQAVSADRSFSEEGSEA